MRAIIAIACVLWGVSESRADPPPAEAPVIATAASYREWNQAHDRRRAAQWDPTVTVEEHERNIEDTQTWKKRTCS